MSATITMDGVDVVSIRMLTPWNGTWIADVDLDSSDAPSAGPALIAFASGETFRGIVDSRGSGKFGAKARARVIGGLGLGWDSTVTAQPFHNDAGVLSSVVLASTAAQIGETAIDGAPVRLGVDYARSVGRASLVFGDRDWYVDALGITHVSTRLELPALPSNEDLEILDWDPNQQRAVLASEAPITPGLAITDERVGTIVVRDAEQTWDAKGARTVAWCGPSRVSRLAGALKRFAREATGALYLAEYRYRVVAQNVDGRLALQPIRTRGPLPPIIPLSVWREAGITAKLAPGTECLVRFLEGDPAQPIVTACEPGATPLSLSIDTGNGALEHAATVEAVALLLANFLAFLGQQCGGSPGAAGAAALATALNGVATPTLAQVAITAQLPAWAAVPLTPLTLAAIVAALAQKAPSNPLAPNLGAPNLRVA